MTVSNKERKLSKTMEPEGAIYSLQIFGFPDGTTEWDIKIFMENKRYSGGGDIRRIYYNEEEHCAQVTFMKTAGLLMHYDLLINE